MKEEESRQKERGEIGDGQNHRQTDGDWRGQEVKRLEDFSKKWDAERPTELSEI